MNEETLSMINSRTGLTQPKHIVSLIKEDTNGWWRKNVSFINNFMSAIPFFCRIWFKFECFYMFRLTYKETNGKVYVKPDLTRNW